MYLTGYLSDFRSEIGHATNLLTMAIGEPVDLRFNAEERCAEYKTEKYGTVASVIVEGECGIPETVRVKLAFLLGHQLEAFTAKLQSVFEESFCGRGCRLQFMPLF
jgi:hypothetical protein